MLKNVCTEIYNSKNISLFKVFTFVCFSISISACSVFEEKDDGFDFNTTTEFDRDAIEGKKWKIGDTVRIDFNIKPDRQFKELRVDKSVFGFGYIFEKVPLNDTDQPFTYEFEFPITTEYQGADKIGIVITAEFTTPVPQGSGTMLTRFEIDIE